MTAYSQERLVEQKQRPFRSLRSKILVSFGLLFVATLSLVSFVATFGIPFTAFQGSYSRERNEVFRSLSLTADVKNERFAHWLAERKTETRLVAETDLVEVFRLTSLTSTLSKGGQLEKECSNCGLTFWSRQPKLPLASTSPWLPPCLRPITRFIYHKSGQVSF